MTRQQAEAKWTELREAITDAIYREDVWTEGQIDAEENAIIEAVLDVLWPSQ